MATAQIGVPRDASFIRSGAPEAHAHRAMTNSLPDEDLMLQVREGVGEMLGVLFDRYQSPLFNFYCRLTGDRTASEDQRSGVISARQSQPAPSSSSSASSRSCSWGSCLP